MHQNKTKFRKFILKLCFRYNWKDHYLISSIQQINKAFDMNIDMNMEKSPAKIKSIPLLRLNCNRKNLFDLRAKKHHILVKKTLITSKTLVVFQKLSRQLEI